MQLQEQEGDSGAGPSGRGHAWWDSVACASTASGTWLLAAVAVLCLEDGWRAGKLLSTLVKGDCGGIVRYLTKDLPKRAGQECKLHADWSFQEGLNRPEGCKQSLYCPCLATEV